MMKHGKRASRAVVASAGMAVLAMAAVSSAKAQWFPPFGAAPPSEIIERLKAEGYVPIGPLVRRDTVYLADVKGPAGRGRLVLDAWSGAILQSFVGRGRDWRPGASRDVARGGEFQSPPPLAPPSKGDFLDPHNGFAYGATGGDYPVIVGPDGAHEPQRPRKAHKPAESKPTTAALPAMTSPQTTGAAPSAPLSAPAPVAPAAATASAPAAPPPPAPTAAPKPATPTAAMVESQVPKPAVIPAATPPAAPSGKSKVNDVPVNPLE